MFNLKDVQIVPHSPSHKEVDSTTASWEGVTPTARCRRSPWWTWGRTRCRPPPSSPPSLPSWPRGAATPSPSSPPGGWTPVPLDTTPGPSSRPPPSAPCSGPRVTFRDLVTNTTSPPVSGPAVEARWPRLGREDPLWMLGATSCHLEASIHSDSQWQPWRYLTPEDRGLVGRTCPSGASHVPHVTTAAWWHVTPVLGPRWSTIRKYLKINIKNISGAGDGRSGWGGVRHEAGPGHQQLVQFLNIFEY